MRMFAKRFLDRVMWSLVGVMSLALIASHAEGQCGDPLIRPGNLVVTRASGTSGRVRVFDIFSDAACSHRGDVEVLLLPAGVEFGPNGNLFVASWNGAGGFSDGGVYEFDVATGVLIGQYPESAAIFLTFEPYPVCPADTDFSGEVNVTDLLALLAAWGPCAAPCPPDIDLDGSVNVTDLLALLAAWGACP